MTTTLLDKADAALEPLTKTGNGPVILVHGIDDTARLGSSAVEMDGTGYTITIRIPFNQAPLAGLKTGKMMSLCPGFVTRYEPGQQRVLHGLLGKTLEAQSELFDSIKAAVAEMPALGEVVGEDLTTLDEMRQASRKAYENMGATLDLLEGGAPFLDIRAALDASVVEAARILESTPRFSATLESVLGKLQAACEG